MVQQDTHMMETELLEDFLFAESQQQQQQQQEQQEQQHQQPGSYGGGDGEEQHGDDLFSTFINTDMLLQPSNYTLQPQHTSSMMLGVDAPDLLNGFSEPRQPRKSISPLGGTSDIQSPAPSVSTGLTTPPQAMSYSQGCERLVDRSLQFGRTKPIQSAYLNSSDFLDIPEDTLPYKLVVSGMPSASRVETQIKLELSISPPPREYIVHLPTDCITKQKWYLEDDITTYPREIQNEILYLESFLVCASNGKPTYVCSRCVKREQRRASRRKSGLCDNMLWCNNENRRAVVFNSKQVFSIKDVNCTPQFKSFDLSTRIVCYCRHHKEPEGFKILFVLRNANQEVLAKSLTGPIMIMDKKSNRDAAANTSLQDSVADSNNNTDGSRSERSEIPNVTSTSDFSGMENHKPRDDFMHLSVKGEHMLSPTSMGGDSSEAHATDANVVESYGPRGAASSVSLPDKASGYKRKRSSPDYNSTAIGFSPQNFTKPHANSNFSKSLSASSSNHSIPLLNQPAHNNPTAAMMTATNSMLREISDLAEVPQAPALLEAPPDVRERIQRGDRAVRGADGEADRGRAAGRATSAQAGCAAAEHQVPRRRFANHCLFWKNLAPESQGGGEAPAGALGRQIESQFGSLDKLQALTNAKLAGVQGSGWAFIVKNAENGGQIEVVQTYNQDTVSGPLTPLVAIDAWEHAYYLQYQNRKADYFKAIWNVINWKEAERASTRPKSCHTRPARPSRPPV